MSTRDWENWQYEVPADERAGWYIDGHYASRGIDCAVARPANYVPFQSMFEPDGRHAYHPSDLSYPRNAMMERSLGLATPSRHDREQQWQAVRPAAFVRNGTIELGVRDIRSSGRNSGDSDRERMSRRGDNDDAEYQRILDDVRASREEDRRYQDDRYGGFMQGGSRSGRGDYDQIMSSRGEDYRSIMPTGSRSGGDFMQGGLRSTAGANPALYADDYGRGSGHGGHREDLYEEYFGDDYLPEDYDGYGDMWPRSRGPY